MDNSNEFAVMLDKAISGESNGFKRFDKTKNVQDQLQEMVNANEVTPAYSSITFIMYYAPSITPTTTTYLVDSNIPQFTSMEQLWLAFVMKEKYQKIWNSKEWVKYQVAQ